MSGNVRKYKEMIKNKNTLKMMKEMGKYLDIKWEIKEHHNNHNSFE